MRLDIACFVDDGGNCAELSEKHFSKPSLVIRDWIDVEDDEEEFDCGMAVLTNVDNASLFSG